MDSCLLNVPARILASTDIQRHQTDCFCKSSVRKGLIRSDLSSQTFVIRDI